MKEKRPRESNRPDIMDETLEEHRGCMQVVGEVEQCVTGQTEHAGSWVERLAECLPRLASTLRAHFRVEQEGPLYRTLPVSYPRFAYRLEQLEAEHVRILESVDSITARARDLSGAEIQELRELNAQVQLVIATIRRHEAEENEIVIQAHWDEVGVGD